MNYEEFILKLIDLKPRLRGLGSVAAERSGLSKTDFRNVIAGKIKNPNTLKRVFDSALQVIEEHGKFLLEIV